MAKTAARGFDEQWKVRLYIGKLDPALLPSNQHNPRMLKLKAVLYRALSLALVVFIGVLCARSDVASADGSPGPAALSDSLTHFESFILNQVH